MANAEHVALVGKGSAAIAEWRRANPGVSLDLEGANLSGADLSRANFSRANLTGADLSRANLSRANFTLADLTAANLSRANLWSADLSRANLSEAALIEADLTGANLWRANLTGADLTGANLTGASLWVANLRVADLSGAYLSGAYLRGTDLSAANLSAADLSGAQVGFTTLGDVDLSHAIGLATVGHFQPSSIGVDTLIKSVRGTGGRLTRDLKTFFRAAGVPKELLNKLREIAAEVKYYSSFICYGEPDAKLAERLTNSLRARGASCWWHPTDATPGERTWGEIGARRREAERVVVLCSAAALVRDPVLKEIEEQIDEDPERLVPISTDDLWKAPGFRVARGTGGRDLKPFLTERNWADFDKVGYKKGLERLLVGLRRKGKRKRKGG